MNDLVTRKIIDTYRQTAAVPQFLSSFAVKKFFDSETIQLDIDREDEDVAVVLRDLTNGPNWNESTLLTSKEFKPPVYNEGAGIDVGQLMKRQFGEHNFQSPNFQANATSSVLEVSRKLTNKLIRASELQMAQIMTTGELALEDANGVVRHSLDFQMDPSQFADTATDWGIGVTDMDALADLEAIAHAIHMVGHGGGEFHAIFGRTAFAGFMTDEKVLKLLDNRRIELGSLYAPQMSGGGLRHGSVATGNFTYDLWTYPGYYKDPATGDRLPYIPDDKVVIIAKDAQFRRAFGSIPRFAAPEQRVLKYLPSQLTADFAVNPYAWINQDGTALSITCGTRMLTYPLTVNKVGCLTVTD